MAGMVDLDATVTSQDHLPRSQLCVAKSGPTVPWTAHILQTSVCPVFLLYYQTNCHIFSENLAVYVARLCRRPSIIM